MKITPFLLLLVLAGCRCAERESLETVSAHTFFGARLNQPFCDVLGYYQSQQYLHVQEEPDAEQDCPPLERDKGGPQVFYFEEHPYLKTLKGQGQLVVRRLDNDKASMELVYLFKGHRSAERFADAYLEQLKKAAIRKKRQGNETDYEVLGNQERLTLRLVPLEKEGTELRIQLGQP
jgi:hypothetical protein